MNLLRKLDPMYESRIQIMRDWRFRIWPGTREIWIHVGKIGMCLHWGGIRCGRYWKLIG
jgi:hypothetical protein